jgi:hypothetical protein
MAKQYSALGLQIKHQQQMVIHKLEQRMQQIDYS